MTDPNWTFTARLAGVLALLAPGVAFTETDPEADESAMRSQDDPGAWAGARAASAEAGG